MLIIGAKGFAKELLNLLEEQDSTARLSFYDDVNKDLPALLYDKYPIVKNEAEAQHYFRTCSKRFNLGIGNPTLREKLHHKFVKLGGQPASIISKNASIGSVGNIIGLGASILRNVIIETDNRISEGCLIHVGSFISHDTIIGRFCEISPFAKLLGNVEIGDLCSLGTGCIILPKVRIGDNVVVGAGAVVTKDVSSNTTVVGIPAKPYIR